MKLNEVTVQICQWIIAIQQPSKLSCILRLNASSCELSESVVSGSLPYGHNDTSHE